MLARFYLIEPASFVRVKFIVSQWFSLQHWSYMKGPKFKVAYLGLSFGLSCFVNNPENYNFTFFHKKPSQSQTTKLDINGTNRFKQDKSILTITKVIFDDGGVYSCEVRNQTNHLVKTINLGHVFVQKAPIFQFHLYPKKPSILVNEGNRFELRCEYDRIGAKITWWRVIQISSNISKVIPREKISVKKDVQKQIECYVIDKISLGDSGAYTCEVMEGSKSKFTHTLALQVIENKKPAFGHIEDVLNTSEGKFEFEINLEVFGEPSPNITCSIGGKEIISCSGKTIAESTIHKNSCKRNNFEITIDYYLLITEVFYSEHHGKYSCVATNIVGSANTTFTVDVTVRPAISKGNSEFFYHEEYKKGIVTCTVREANPKPVINWYSQELRKIDDNSKQDKWVRSNLKQSLISFPGGKYESTLTIPANQGKSFYMCNATNSAGSSTRVFKFLRYSRGINPLIVIPSNTVERNEGETFVAECRVAISIPGQIVIFKENSGIKVVNKTRTKLTLTKGSTFRNLTMTITNLTVNDSGTYRCTEEKLTNHEASVNLKVDALRPTTIFSLRNKTVIESPDTIAVELFCNISGNPLPEMTWLKNDKTFKQTDLTENNCKNIQPGYYHYKNVPHKLIICKPRRIDTGFYTCLAKNQLGNASRKAYLNVLSTPKIQSPQLLKKEKINKGERYTIRCTAVGNPSPFVQWTKRAEQDNNPATNQSIGFSDLVIESMDESYEGNYSCLAKNRLNIVVKRLLEMEMIQPVPNEVLDIDECSRKSNHCHKYANCTNTVGGFICTCKEGFRGDGKTCQASKGKSHNGKTIGLAIGLAVMVVVLIVLIGLAVRYVRSRHSNTLEIDPDTGKKKRQNRSFNSELLPLSKQGNSELRT